MTDATTWDDLSQDSFTMNSLTIYEVCPKVDISVRPALLSLFKIPPLLSSTTSYSISSTKKKFRLCSLSSSVIGTNATSLARRGLSEMM
jgi:hypothetical protein